MRRCLFALLLVVIGIAQPVLAWNGTGHKAISLVAYNRLSPAVKQRVDSLLAKHPDYPKWIAGVPIAERGRAAFLAASVWPDQIRSDPRFYGDNDSPTPPIPGLPDGAQLKHAEWHYVDTPFSTDGTPTVPAVESNALRELEAFDSAGRMSEAMQVYLLPWILHVTEDVHQPLHTMMRFTANDHDGDRGGNTVRLQVGSNLHSYWDGQLGREDGDLNQLAATIQERNPRPATLDMQPRHWIDEGFASRQQVYSFTGPGTQENPGVTSDEYARQANKLAFQRAALAGYRLAEFLNTHFNEK
jgi:hypothetical protein